MQATPTQFTEVNLVSDGTIPAAFTDPNLVNAWGLASSPTGPFWVANNGTGTATLYNGHGQAQPTETQPLVVTIPPPPGGSATAAPTGAIFNGTTDFAVSANGQSGPAAFLFATEDGTISGWNPSVNATNAVIAVDNSATGAIYKGLTTGTVNGQQFLYVTNFSSARVHVFDANFNPVTLPGDFRDRRLPTGYAPFGIANINGQIYVSYALQDAQKADDVPGQGRGFVDVFSTDGVLVRRLIQRGRLNAPWGMVQAPTNFGGASGSLLVGNFGDGTINAYNPTTGRFIGTLRDRFRHPITIDGLWSLRFGNGGAAGATNTLFFTAGPDDEQHGLFGLIGVRTPTGTTTTSGQGTTQPTNAAAVTTTTPITTAPTTPITTAPTTPITTAPTTPITTAPTAPITTTTTTPASSTLLQGNGSAAVVQTNLLEGSNLEGGNAALIG